MRWLIGEGYHRLGYMHQAIAAYEQSLALQPDRQDATDNLALLQQLKQQQQQQEQEQQQEHRTP